MSTGVEYVIASYGVMAFTLVIYIIVATMKRARLARETELLDRLAAQRQRDAGIGEAERKNAELVDS